MENAKGVANAQAELATSQVNIEIKTNYAKAREKEGEGDASYTEQTGTAKGAEPRAVGLANAEAYEKQVAALDSSRLPWSISPAR